MAETIFVQGNEAVGWGALAAGCDAFFGYPITPQNEITEWFSREFPPRGKVFLQTPSEVGSINMLYGAAAAGVRVMTSTASPGWALMQESISHMVNAELPCVIVLVQRGGPGQGTTRHAQMDYLSATRGGGQGGYKNIVLTPASVQETHDLVQLAFYLADKYRNPTIVMSDGIIGQLAENLEVRSIDFGPLLPKDWAVGGVAEHEDGQKRVLLCTTGLAMMPPHPTYLGLVAHLDKKYRQMAESELRYEMQQVEDAELVIVTYGYCARVAEEAMLTARAQGLKVGLIRLLTAWPFPYEVIREKARQGCRFLVVEDSLGLMVDDVETAAQGRTEVHLLGMLARHAPREIGMIFPETVLEEVRRLL